MAGVGPVVHRIRLATAENRHGYQRAARYPYAHPASSSNSPGGGNPSRTAGVFAVNGAGQVVGESGPFAGSANNHAFLYSGGVMHDLGTLGGSFSTARAINGAGQVVGYADPGSGVPHAFLYQNGSMTDLGMLAGQTGGGIARGINASGQVVGVSGKHAFLYQNGSMTDLGTLPGGTSSDAYAINNAGVVVGNADAGPGMEHAFVYQNGVMTDLGALVPGGLSGAFGVNDAGQVVGSANVNGGAPHAFLYENGVMTDLNSLIPAGSGWTLNWATAVNDNGQIVGWGTINGETHAFRLDPTPVPEPSAVVLFGIGAVTLISCRRPRWRTPASLWPRHG
jgi:probable HAF family extracellular repeat protein